MIDVYSKCVLTVIAVALVFIAVIQMTSRAAAQTGFTRVQLCDTQNCINLIPIPQNIAGRTYTVYGMPIVNTR